ncbi:hypothetical protein OKW41_000444 [Paraburkholderia sp. UCT70]|uniref:hypothetical protein n=1 Tax=Paraburkholderia sp. UCT70 TaxID=2991068 RepID=UPI003D198C84
MSGAPSKAVNAVATHRLDGMTGLDAIVVREGKNIKGLVLAFVFGTVGRHILERAFPTAARRSKPGIAQREENATVLVDRVHGACPLDFGIGHCLADESEDRFGSFPAFDCAKLIAASVAKCVHDPDSSLAIEAEAM